MIDLKSMQPQENYWYEKEITYEGIGYMTFTNPKGWVKGKAIAHFDEIGNSQITITVEEFECEGRLSSEISDSYKLDWLLTGIQPVKMGGMIHLPSPIEPLNQCSGFEIKTETGVFKADKDVKYLIPFIGFEERKIIHIYSYDSVYTSDYSFPTNYWVFPLINFVTEQLNSIRPRWNQVYLQYDYHPMRFILPPSLPDNFDTLEENQKNSLISRINQFNAYIPLSHKENIGFIEKLKDYKETATNLLSCKVCQAVTAVMICNTNDTALNIEELPVDYLNLLSLATGCLVGMPWIEFRSLSGEITKRIHKQQDYGHFILGHIAIDNFCNGGIGWFLSNANLDVSPYTRIAIHLTVLGSDKNRMISDRLADLFRAVDTLYKELSESPKLKFVFSDLEREVQVKINLLENELRNLLTQSIANEILEKPDAEIYLNGILKNIDNLKRVVPKEGMKLYRLLDQFGLKDRNIIDEYLKQKNIKDEKNLQDFTSRYRGKVIHDGGVIFTDDKDIYKIASLMFHLNDILLRIILKKLGYTGHYRRAVRIIERVPLDWVTEKTTADELGYK